MREEKGERRKLDLGVWPWMNFNIMNNDQKWNFCPMGDNKSWSRIQFGSSEVEDMQYAGGNWGLQENCV
jgi:hypothetical protein